MPTVDMGLRPRRARGHDRLVDGIFGAAARAPEQAIVEDAHEETPTGVEPYGDKELDEKQVEIELRAVPLVE